MGIWIRIWIWIWIWVEYWSQLIQNGYRCITWNGYKCITWNVSPYGLESESEYGNLNQNLNLNLNMGRILVSLSAIMQKSQIYWWMYCTKCIRGSKTLLFTEANFETGHYSWEWWRHHAAFASGLDGLCDAFCWTRSCQHLGRTLDPFKPTRTLQWESLLGNDPFFVLII